MKSKLLKVALRKNAMYIPKVWMNGVADQRLTESTSVFAANCNKLGYTFDENLLNRINTLTPKAKLTLFDVLREVSGVNKNWTPLVKQWDIPTGESVTDHLITWFANVFKTKKGTTLSCGHIIPDNTFPLERYNGCPFCGTPFEFGALDYEVGKNKLKMLTLWGDEDLKSYLVDLLESPVALDATQVEDLKTLLESFGMRETVEVKMKETLMVLIDVLVEMDALEEVGKLFKTPNDILRYLWYKKTGFLQIVEPKTIIKRRGKNAQHVVSTLNESFEAKSNALSELKLKFSRTECRRYASWLNNLKMSSAKKCENMHPKRGMWVRVIRALRLAEYSKKKGFESLAELLDDFYNERYEVWQGKVNKSKMKMDSDTAFKLLKQRPGLFARSLFSSMLWFGAKETIAHFKEVMDQVPTRLIYTLNMYAEVYFDKNASRTVKPLGGTNKRIPVNQWLKLYSDEDLVLMQKMVRDLSLELIKSKLSSESNSNTSMFIDSGLYTIPIAIGDRNEQIQDLPGALMGTRFKVKGSTVRLFMQWGVGLKAQHLDMDLSCRVAYENKSEFCSYSQMVIPGCIHSGDIRHIPEKVGTAEYIDIDLDELTIRNAKYVSFTCNAYSNGALSPNMVVGWMNSKEQMKITPSGVAYNPTAVQHQVRITQTLAKGMVFGVLDVMRREILWLEMGFGGQVVQNLDLKTVEGLMQKLDAKLKIGDLLKLKADVQGLEIVEDSEAADEVYTMDWALNTAEVAKLFL